MFYIIIPSCIRVLHPDQLKSMLPAYGLFPLIPLFYGLICQMLLPIQLNGKYRDLPVAEILFIQDKIKPPVIKQAVSRGIFFKYLGYGYFFFYRAFPVITQYIFKGVI